MKPARYNIKFYRGTTLNIVMTYLINNVPVDLANYTATMDVRVSPNSVAPMTTLSTANGKLVLNAVTGEIEIVLTATQTGELTLGTFQYDLNITSPNGTVTKLIQGAFVVLDPVTE